MKGHNIEVTINGNKVYNCSPKVLISDLNEIGGFIKVKINEIGGYEVTSATKESIKSVKSIANKQRLVALSTAVDYNLDIEVYIDDKLIFSSVDEALYIMTNLREDNLNFFKNEIKRRLDNDLDIDVAASDYIKAKLITEIYEEYINEEEDPYI
jgi:hypothetical protein